ncbi:MAG: hypothetical protein ACLQVL_28110, partial [Terriglobia bacterium]
PPARAAHPPRLDVAGEQLLAAPGDGAGVDVEQLGNLGVQFMLIVANAKLPSSSRTHLLTDGLRTLQLRCILVSSNTRVE